MTDAGAGVEARTELWLILEAGIKTDEGAGVENRVAVAHFRGWF